MMSPEEKDEIIKKLVRLSDKRETIQTLIMCSGVLVVLIAWSVPGIIAAVVLFIFIQGYALDYKNQVFAPLILKDRILQEKLFQKAKKAQTGYILVLRPHQPSAFHFSAEPGAGTGVGFSGAPHPVRQPCLPYQHGYPVFDHLERHFDSDFTFVALGDIQHAYSMQGLKRTIFISSPIEHWQQTIDMLIKNASRIIFVPDSSQGMLTELDNIMTGNMLSKCLFLIPASNNPNRRAEARSAAWQKIVKVFQAAGIEMPDAYDSSRSIYMAVINGQLLAVHAEKFLALRSSAARMKLGPILMALIKDGLINEDHFKNLYEDKLVQKLKPASN